MKHLKYYITPIILSISLGISGQNQFEHKIVAGLNLGATAPVGLPAEIRSIDSYWPQFTPRLGYMAKYNVNKDWGVGSGIILDYKGMGTKASVKYIYTRVKLEEGNESNVMEGYFVGKNKTEVKSANVTIPLTAIYNLNDKWSLRAGGYASYAFSKEFYGEVSDGYLRRETITGTKIDIDRAEFDFNSDMKKFDYGVILGAEMKINERFGILADLNWGLTPIFPSSFTGMKFDMYNIYMAVALTYKL